MTSQPHAGRLPAPMSQTPPLPASKPQTLPLVAPMPQMPPMAAALPVPPEQLASTRPRPRGTARSARMALLVSALIAAGGVSFALGRMSAESGGASAGPAFPSGGVPAAAAAAGTGPSSGSDVSASGTDQVEVVALSAAAIDTEATTSEVPDPAVTDTEVTSLGSASTGSGPADEPTGFAGPMDGPPGLGAGPGGVQGTVADISDIAAGTLIITVTDGSTQEIAVGDTTAWVRQEPIEMADLQVADTVSVQMPFGGRGGGQADEGTTAVATQVVVTSP